MDIMHRTKSSVLQFIVTQVESDEVGRSHGVYISKTIKYDYDIDLLDSGINPSVGYSFLTTNLIIIF